MVDRIGSRHVRRGAATAVLVALALAAVVMACGRSDGAPSTGAASSHPPAGTSPLVVERTANGVDIRLVVERGDSDLIDRIRERYELEHGTVDARCLPSESFEVQLRPERGDGQRMNQAVWVDGRTEGLEVLLGAYRSIDIARDLYVWSAAVRVFDPRATQVQLLDGDRILDDAPLTDGWAVLTGAPFWAQLPLPEHDMSVAAFDAMGTHVASASARRLVHWPSGC